MIAKCKLILIAVLLPLVFISCTPPTYKEAENNAKNNKSDINDRKEEDQKPLPVVTNVPGSYVDLQPVSLDRPPEWLNNRVIINGSNLPFDYYAKKILSKTNTVIKYDYSIDQGTVPESAIKTTETKDTDKTESTAPVEKNRAQPNVDGGRNKNLSMSYRGTIKGALNKLAAQSGYSYTVFKDKIVWSRFETKTFSIAFLPGDLDYQVGGTGNDDSDSNNSSGGNGTSNVVVTSGLSNDDQFSNLKGTVSVWKDMESMIQSLLSPDGKMQVSQATTTITIRDYPENVQSIGEYINQMNIELSKQVRLQIEVLEVTLNKDASYGINWDTVIRNGDFEASIVGNFASNAAINTSNSPMAITLNRINGTNYQTVINALSDQGNVSVVTRPTVVTLNNQVAEIDITQEQAYLESTDSDSTGSGETAVISNTLNPGVVKTGFMLYILPKIKGDQVYMQLTSTLSDLIDIQTINQAGSTTNTDNLNAIQVPTIDKKQFNQRSEVRTGQTLILSGFMQNKDQTKKSAMMGVDALGGKGALQKRTEIVILVTPTIIGMPG